MLITATSSTVPLFCNALLAITYSYAGDAALNGATNTSTSLTVNTASLAVTATAQSKSYGQTLAFGSGSTNFSSLGLQNGETIGSVTLAVSSSGGASNAPVSGSPYTITPSAATGGTFNANNYAIAYNTNALTVNPATLTVTADDLSRAYGATNPVFTATYTNFWNQRSRRWRISRSATSRAKPRLDQPEPTPIVTFGAYTDHQHSTGTLASTNYTFSLSREPER